MTISAGIRDYALEMGVSLVGFAPAWRWAERGEVEPGFRPEAIWSETKTVICLGLPSLLPIVETLESDLYRAQYDIANRILDETAYSLARFLNIRGWPSIPVCRDGYGEQKMLRQIPRAAFSHVWAGFYAGLGTIGWNQTLITPEFGPRHRLASVFTSLELAGDPMLGSDLCTGCRVCARVCPAGVYSDGPRGLAMDKLACARQTFGTLYDHCGFCVKACPVGQDRRLFSGADISSYHRAHADVARWSMGLFPMWAREGEQVSGARNEKGSDDPARWTENGRHVGCPETGHITPSEEIPDKANRLGAELVLILPQALVVNLGPGLTAPTRVWDRTQTLIVLGIR
ncbi:MAG: 4Fe-4S binding protein, partial [Deltaproteobacteria bacterium]|nr:4Fe-4S binding protein [Deltaproteobacteria bacterium]